MSTQIKLRYKGQLTVACTGQQVLPAIPNPTGGVISGTPYACIVNGYFSVLFACLNGGSSHIGWRLCSVDDLGNICVYESPNLQRTTLSQVNFYDMNVMQSGNVFNLFSVGVQFTIPNVFIPNTKIIVAGTKFNPPCPCNGVGVLHSTTFIQNKNLVAYQFVQDFALNYNEWVAFYNGNLLLAGGYLGNFPNGTEHFNLFTQTLPPNSGASPTSPFYKNGEYVFSPFGSVGFVNQKVGATALVLVGSPLSLRCNLPPASPLYIGSGQDYYCPLNTIVPPINTGMAQGDCQGGATDIPFTHAISTINDNALSQPIVVLYNQAYYQEIALANVFYWGANNFWGALSLRNKIYTGVDTSGVNGLRRQYQIFSSNMPAGFAVSLSPPPSLTPGGSGAGSGSGVGGSGLTRNYFRQLCNYHRAISPSGAFQA